tara:strand:- start:6320 stop:6502 length:183 start_codon:yes stop_codon:yes gene_type:complete
MEKSGINPVGKIRLIVNMMTDDTKLQASLLSCITHELTVEQINRLFDEITITNKQLKLWK